MECHFENFGEKMCYKEVQVYTQRFHCLTDLILPNTCLCSHRIINIFNEYFILFSLSVICFQWGPRPAAGVPKMKSYHLSHWTLFGRSVGATHGTRLWWVCFQGMAPGGIYWDCHSSTLSLCSPLLADVTVGNICLFFCLSLTVKIAAIFPIMLHICNWIMVQWLTGTMYVINLWLSYWLDHEHGPYWIWTGCASSCILCGTLTMNDIFVRNIDMYLHLYHSFKLKHGGLFEIHL